MRASGPNSASGATDKGKRPDNKKSKRLEEEQGQEVRIGKRPNRMGKRPG